MLTQEYLFSMVEYCEGNLFWKQSIGRAKKGDLIGQTIDQHGYRKFQINHQSMLVHRVIFFYHYNYFPQLTDHIDGNRLNNKIENLREITSSQNSMNRKILKKNKLQSKNICYIKNTNKYRVQIFTNGKHSFSKDFETLELAELVAFMAREKYHNKYLNHGEL